MSVNPASGRQGATDMEMGSLRAAVAAATDRLLKQGGCNGTWASEFKIPALQFAVPSSGSSQFAVRSSQFAVRSSQFAVRSSQFAVRIRIRSS